MAFLEYAPQMFTLVSLNYTHMKNLLFFFLEKRQLSSENISTKVGMTTF